MLDEYQFVKEVEFGENDDATNENLRAALKSDVDYIDLENIELYSDFKKPIVAIATTHESIHTIE